MSPGIARQVSRAAVVLALVIAPGFQLAAQSFNIDFGTPGTSPPDTYEAAGLAGAWQTLLAENGTTTDDLVTLDGTVTAVSLRQIGATQNLLVGDPDIQGDHSLLMDDFLVTYNAAVETCLFFQGLQSGRYQVILYALFPAAPAILSFTNCDEEENNPHKTVGGPWPGGHAPGISFAYHDALVTSGSLQVHSGIVPGADPLLGAALNGIQVRFLSACAADMTGPAGTGPDGVVDALDFDYALARWRTASIAADIADADPFNEVRGDGRIDIHDLLAVLAAEDACP